jgi:cyclophilin family peptidyl-prolyl cis-trans isomerase
LSAALLRSWWRLDGADVATVGPFTTSDIVDVRLAAALALRRLDDANALPLLAPMLEDADAEVRIMAALGMSAAPRRIAEERALPLLGDRDPRFVCALLGWLGTAWAADPTIDDLAFETVLRRSFDRSVHVRRCALRALGAGIPGRAVAADRLLEALLEPEEAVRVDALEVLAGRGQALRDEAVRRVHPEAELSPVRLAEWSQRPREEGAVARLLVAAGRESLVEDWLVATRGSTHMTMLSALLPEDPAQVYRRLLEMPLDDTAVLGLIGRAHLGAPSTVEAAVAEDLADRLWRLYYDTPLGDPRRAAALRALDSVAPTLVERRRELVFADGDRTIRDWAVQRWAGDGTNLPELDVILAPHWTERTAADYELLAADALRSRATPPHVRVTTPRGDVLIELRPDWAPLTAMQFLRLVDDGYFDGTTFYRVIAGFVTQGGGSAAGLLAPRLRNEDAPVDYARGVLGMALSGRDTGTAHWFLTHAAQPHLRGEYPVFGRVIEGQRVVERIQPGDRMTVQREGPQ